MLTMYVWFMEENKNNPANEEELRDENAFLKMKLMLEHGATLSDNGSPELPADIENIFLQNVIAFEKQWQETKQIKIYDKIGRPTQFRSHTEINDNDIERSWDELREYMNLYGVDLDACSPNVSKRELYRFAIEELFEHETDDISLPGWITHFIYDEFHPDHVYENIRTALDYGVRMLLSKAPIEWLYSYRKDELRLNKQYPLTSDEFCKIVNRFKECYEEIELRSHKHKDCLIEGNNCIVMGDYSVDCLLAGDNVNFSGAWSVKLKQTEEYNFWEITEVLLEGIPF